MKLTDYQISNLAALHDELMVIEDADYLVKLTANDHGLGGMEVEICIMDRSFDERDIIFYVPLSQRPSVALALAHRARQILAEEALKHKK